MKNPTPWRAGMVVVPNKTGAVRICVDLKPLNGSVSREVHPITRVDEALVEVRRVPFDYRKVCRRLVDVVRAGFGYRQVCRWLVEVRRVSFDRRLARRKFVEFRRVRPPTMYDASRSTESPF